MIKLARLVVPAFLLLSCASPLPEAVPTAKGRGDLEVLFSFVTGTWDAKPREPPVRIRMVEFWKGGPVGWLYLEWVRPGDEAKPLRQLVFRFAERKDGKFETTVHRLPGEAARFAGEWRNPQPFAGLRPADLAEIPGCRMEAYRAMLAHFVAVTQGNKCPGDLPGVPYMRFEFSITSSELDLLEQPRDAAGNVPPKSRLEPFRYARISREAK
jgi:hypothetical protein